MVSIGFISLIGLPTLIVAIEGNGRRREDDNLCNLVHLDEKVLCQNRAVELSFVKETTRVSRIHTGGLLSDFVQRID